MQGSARQVSAWVYKAKQEVCPRIAPRQKLPVQTGLPGINLFWACSHLHLKHWGSVLYFQWRRTVILIQELMAEILISPPKGNKIQELLPDEICQDRWVWLALASPGLLLIYT